MSRRGAVGLKRKAECPTPKSHQAASEASLLLGNKSLPGRARGLFPPLDHSYFRTTPIELDFIH